MSDGGVPYRPGRQRAPAFQKKESTSRWTSDRKPMVIAGQEIVELPSSTTRIETPSSRLERPSNREHASSKHSDGQSLNEEEAIGNGDSGTHPLPAHSSADVKGSEWSSFNSDWSISYEGANNTWGWTASGNTNSKADDNVNHGNSNGNSNNFDPGLQKGPEFFEDRKPQIVGPSAKSQAHTDGRPAQQELQSDWSSFAQLNVYDDRSSCSEHGSNLAQSGWCIDASSNSGWAESAANDTLKEVNAEVNKSKQQAPAKCAPAKEAATHLIKCPFCHNSFECAPQPPAHNVSGYIPMKKISASDGNAAEMGPSNLAKSSNSSTRANYPASRY